MSIPENIREKDLDNLQQAIDDIRRGYVTTDAARIRYYAALVSRGALALPRVTECTWDITAAAREYRAAS